MAQQTRRQSIKVWQIILVVGVLAAVALVAVRVLALDDLPPAVPSDWQMIEGGDGTACAFDTPYRFFARTGTTPDKLLIFFQPGGGCWTASTCSTTIYDQAVQDDEPLRYTGVLDAANPANPLRDYNMVFVPYCTGDVHVGDAEVTYRFGLGGGVTVNHRGYDNAAAALEWVYDTYPTPQQIVVAGSSAGAVGALLPAGNVMERYADARVTFIGDSYVGIVPPAWEALETWRADANLPDYITGNTLETFTVEGLYRDIAGRFPNNRFALYTQAADVFQISFYGLSGGAPATWTAQRQALMTRIGGLPNLETYTSGGFLHVVLLNERLYSITLPEMRFVDWLTTLIAGEPVQDLSCQVGALNCP